MGQEAKEFANTARENEFIDDLVTKIGGAFNKNIPKAEKMLLMTLCLILNNIFQE